MAIDKKQINRLDFITGIREEMKHVTWPTRKEAIQLTTTVIVISLIVALFVGIIDVLLARVLEFLAR
ncbi:preprotein translocase subunit SecE [Candidatus Roizmanbacteria bacterium RIFCSPLOWO2_02_FULL_37_19]|uniref:Protein translocase subunit SecE n=1 Tax=Candidatus Roizmanbacteria bacterium RIFCSPHIGHO2_02_FULL_37_24 TaxID=1802037 RepID=A0A1F7GVD5_9BACT|nr:MAG: preprotein translocase subunit SecE [Candidatus Roizmanbacteria bacterium RIFCSPHIGHO2_01_FULL_38_41]OGK22754.1 MAG: preprotein translocase subunit SecE [Candidatus Roizmanbacteria bacterium RIFCSPHIGHO2_02_FULL_37_24]OGK33526.1 MAG: preprotein translocase subunit SecE [Candidatus Roizmanbacteria bacterium RIFCSPHIGHO2_12_FULL_37_23]OGK44406.1 MAG: preprotein translocase subunit SecE [Candidatus Roizmanbacteria bacterium RIFCSPLOWO2_01_FULL_37_57]OGK55065.1 MAG: preprotein translocase s